MPGSPQRNTRVGKRPRAFPEWRGVPAKHHTHGHRVTEILPGLGYDPKSREEYSCGGGVGVGVVGCAREKSKGTRRRGSE